MATEPQDNLLERLAHPDGDPQVWESVAATPARHESTERAAASDDDPKLDVLLERISHLTKKGPETEIAPATVPNPSREEPPALPAPTPEISIEADTFLPEEPRSFRDAGLSVSTVEELVLKYLLSRGDAAGRVIADQIKLPFGIMDELLRQMKYDQLLVYRDSAPMSDYIYRLTDVGRERSRRLAEQCTYFGAAPVPLEAYCESIAAQSLTAKQPTEDDLKRAFEDLLINQEMLNRLGPAINSGRGLFLFGAPGNGKTSIAERITKTFGDCVWVPRALWIDGEIMRIFDPMNHEEEPLAADGGILSQTKIDARWVRIRRPTIVVGGELKMNNLEVSFNATTGISEAPLQLKSNCGTLVIDDFGRQTMSTDELLNRWIVPLEKRYDFLNLANGKKIQVPFDQLIIFSTNLEPRDLVDEAFLRRIPYKIEIIDPTESEFRQLFRLMCPGLGFEFDDAAIDYLIETHYQSVNRPLRACQPRDLLLQIRNSCLYQSSDPRLTADNFDFAVENYFAVM